MASPTIQRDFILLYFLFIYLLFFGEVGGGWGLLIRLLKIENKTIILKIKIYKKVQFAE